MIKVILGNTLYEMSKRQLNHMIQAAKDVCSDKNSIVCVRKEGIATMMNDDFDTNSELMKNVESYKNQGFKVSYTTGGNHG